MNKDSIEQPGLGLGPHVTIGFRPVPNAAVEVSASYAWLSGLSSRGGPLTGSLISVEIGGSLSF